MEDDIFLCQERISVRTTDAISVYRPEFNVIAYVVTICIMDCLNALQKHKKTGEQSEQKNALVEQAEQKNTLVEQSEQNNTYVEKSDQMNTLIKQSDYKHTLVEQSEK